MKVRYIGASGSRMLEAIGQVVKRGEEIDVSDELGERLCRSGLMFEPCDSAGRGARKKKTDEPLTGEE
jgi:hypothetical protein